MDILSGAAPRMVDVRQGGSGPTIHHPSLGRARVIVTATGAHSRTTDVSQGFEQSLIVAEKEAVVAAVQTWLSEMLAGSLAGEDDPHSLSNT
jgi:hypothetical protein